MEDLERIGSRLDNIEGVAPILTALRNIAAGTWRLARTRLEASRAFTEELGNIARAVQPFIRQKEAATTSDAQDAPETVGMLVIASERGLCGAFNAVVNTAADSFVNEEREKKNRVKVMTLGARASRYFRREDIPLLFSESLPVTTVPSLSLVQRLYREIYALYSKGEFTRAFAVYTPYHAYAVTKPVLRQIMPIHFEAPEGETPIWSEPILDVEAQLIYERVQRQWAVVNLYRIVLESAASEQAARYRVLDGASSNCERLIEELTLAYHAARQHAITMEMLDLVGGAGLLKAPETKRGDDTQ